MTLKRWLISHLFFIYKKRFIMERKLKAKFYSRLGRRIPVHFWRTQQQSR